MALTRKDIVVMVDGGRVALQLGERIPTIGARAHFVTLVCEQSRERFLDGGVVVHQENPLRL